MKVILLQDVLGKGKKYEVREVPDGYARNFLFPKKIAEPATSVSLKNIDEQKARAIAEEAETKKRLEEIAHTLNERRFEFPVKTDASGKVYGSVTKEMILRALREHAFVTKERVDIVIDRALKTLGDHRIEAVLPKGVRATFIASLVPEP